MSDAARQPKHLPRDLTTAVGDVIAILGEVIAEAAGTSLFDTVESIRRDMVTLRDASDGTTREAMLTRARGRIAALSLADKASVARAFTLYLELVNVCENAYRSHRLLERGGRDPGAGRAQLTFVLTAHPTESRSPENIRLLRRAQEMLLRCLREDLPVDRDELGNLLHLAWRVGTHPPHKPSVEDEARHLFSLLTDPILDEMATLTQRGHRVRFRTWVGGDKDGHPGVGPEQTRASLQLSRTRLLAFVRGPLLASAREDAALAGGEALLRSQADLDRALADLQRLDDGDGARIGTLYQAVEAFGEAYRRRVGSDPPAVTRLTNLLQIFPALVVPLELREERGHFGDSDPIAAMMRALRDVAAGGRVDGYVRGCVVSMTCAASDLSEAQRLVDDTLGDGAVPVIPLFELPDVLRRATDILRDAWTDASFRRAVEARGHLEVMLGYSDTAKRMGMLASRVTIHQTMRGIANWAESEQLTPVFFHGHGGSVGRGGGRIEDLLATWPPAARTPYKYTLQGEMVERTLATPAILRRLVLKVAQVQHEPPAYREVSELGTRLAQASEQEFKRVVGSASFGELRRAATPYARLAALTIGSRPVKRSGAQHGLETLRAIPWVLCWTQTRLLLHAWLGAGAAWRACRDEPDASEQLLRASSEDPLLHSYLRLLAFTIAKTAPALWRCYRTTLAPDSSAELVGQLDDSFDQAVDLARRVTGDAGLLPDRPWLEESIRYRAPMIHPLNLMQIELLDKPSWSEEDERLFRETVTGIAAGMLTTG
jgi:phosphoenolpyruvate carboxylase